MTFSDQDLKELQKERAQSEQARRRIMFRAARLQLQSAQAKRTLFEGVLRRLKFIHQCTAMIFELIPPGTSEPPPERSINLATICLQAHFFHVVGFVDCLAHVWILEKGITQSDGQEVPRTWIGFGRSNSFVRSTLPKEALEVISAFDSWFEFIEKYRHSLAHRIPLYIPPHFVDPTHAENYSTLNAAWLTAYDEEESARLQREMDAISHFKSLALFDLDEAPSIFFHPQIIADRKTIEVIASAVFDALEGTPTIHQSSATTSAFSVTQSGSDDT